jgi:ADP-ribose pyrophosphatase YjhB (NUDIX family)
MRPRSHCPECGGSLGPILSDAQHCTACGGVLWFNAKPCAAVLVLDAVGRVLLARRGVEPSLGLWDLPGGFCGASETPEDCAVRELREETGCAIEVTAVLGHLIDTYGDDGDFTLNVVLTARILDGLPAPADDVAELRWFALDALPPAPQLAFRNTCEALALLRAD